MSISADTMWTQKQRQYSQEASSSRFTTSYISAVNYALRRAYRELDLAAVPTLISDTATAIDLDAAYEEAFSLSVDTNLIRFGHRSGDLDLRTSESMTQDAWNGARLYRDTANTAAATNGETFGDVDIISTS